MKHLLVAIATSAALMATVGVTASAAGASPAITFTPAKPMNKARAFFTATNIPDDRVLVAGGYDGSCQCAPNFADSEIYSWDTGIWTPTAPMNSARAAAVAVRLEGGHVMVIGGFDENFAVLNSAEIYHPRTATWSLTAPMTDARAEDFTAVQFGARNNKVLVAGGTGSDGSSLSSSEIYDISANAWTPTGSMNVGRGEFTTVKLRDGRVLAIGGESSDGTALASAEIYHTAHGTWSLTGSMSTGRNDVQAVVLHDGRVLVAGGGTGSEENPRLASAEIYDPNTGKWTPTGDMTAPRSEAEYAAVRLQGLVLVPGGLTAPHTNIATTDLYDPSTGTWTAGGPMSEPRSGHFSVVSPSSRNQVLVMGGLDVGPAATASVDMGQATR